MRIDCVFAPQLTFSWKLAFCARAEIEHVIATIFQPGGRSEISARVKTPHEIRLLLLANKCRDYCRVKRLHHIYKYGITSSSRILLRVPYAPLGDLERRQ